MLYKVKEQLKSIPPSIKKFALRALSFFLCWQMVYVFLLLPNRFLDKHLSLYTGKATAYLLSNTITKQPIKVNDTLKKDYIENYFENSNSNLVVLEVSGKKLIGIADGCNGLSISMLFIGFIVSFPSPLTIKLNFIVSGLGIILITNILRCYGLGAIQYYHPKYMHFAHHYLFNTITYIVIFLIWVKFVKIVNKQQA